MFIYDPEPKLHTIFHKSRTLIAEVIHLQTHSLFVRSFSCPIFHIEIFLYTYEHVLKFSLNHIPCYFYKRVLVVNFIRKDDRTKLVFKISIPFFEQTKMKYIENAAETSCSRRTESKSLPKDPSIVFTQD